MSSVAIVIEDALSEGVIRRLIHHTHRDWTVGVRYPLHLLAGGRSNPRNVEERRGLSGFGQIKVQMPAFNNLAKLRPIIVLTDLDVHVQCPGDLWGKWMPNVTKHPNLILRVAIKEVEAWLLADRDNMADLLSISVGNMPAYPEALADPKIEIVNLARNSPSDEVKHALVPVHGSTAEVGRSFDTTLAHFARNTWDIDAAVKTSNSLNRAVKALKSFKFT